MTWREYMEAHDNNVHDMYMNGDTAVSPCYAMTLGGISVTVFVGEIQTLEVDGKEVDVTPEAIKEVAIRLNSDYSLYKGYTDTYILIEALEQAERDGVAEKLPCRKCPWFATCDQMEQEVDFTVEV